MSKLGDTIVPTPKKNERSSILGVGTWSATPTLRACACVATSHRVAPLRQPPRASSRGARTEFWFYNTETFS